LTSGSAGALVAEAVGIADMMLTPLDAAFTGLIWSADCAHSSALASSTTMSRGARRSG
jgi:hypothetical protein